MNLPEATVVKIETSPPAWPPPGTGRAGVPHARRGGQLTESVNTIPRLDTLEFVGPVVRHELERATVHQRGGIGAGARRPGSPGRDTAGQRTAGTEA